MYKITNLNNLDNVRSSGSSNGHYPIQMNRSNIRMTKNSIWKFESFLRTGPKKGVDWEYELL